ncbi:MAG: ABC transporter ATP-binding protein [Candidatus Omnitrophica bacterium]|nr:ABC transporter ATP-binding protein [Candidatus Omnitrophota bacterium]
MPEEIVEINNLTKYYNRRLNLFSLEKVQALDALNLTIYKGDIFALLGPNGAGKTTTLNIIAGLLRQSGGEVKVFGENFNVHSDELRCKIGYLSEENILPDYVSVKELLEFLANIFGQNSALRKKRIEYLIEIFNLEGLLKKHIHLLSSGQKRIIGVACALINEPDLLILDEPTVYLDPLAVKHLSNIIISLKDEGKTVIVSSHILSQVEKLCNRLAIIKDGKLKLSAKTEDVLSQRSLDDVFLEVTS